jgi:hypothetical protein
MMPAKVQQTDKTQKGSSANVVSEAALGER